MDIEYKVEFSYEEFRGMLTKIGSFSIRKMRIARLVCIALWAVICLSILIGADSFLSSRIGRGGRKKKKQQAAAGESA